MAFASATPPGMFATSTVKLTEEIESFDIDSET